MERRYTIDPQHSRAAIADIGKALDAVISRCLGIADERDALRERIRELDAQYEELGNLAAKLQADREWWEAELAQAPQEPPEESLSLAVDKLLQEDDSYSAEQIIERLDSSYFPDGITSNVKRIVSMHRRWSLERLGKWKPRQ